MIDKIDNRWLKMIKDEVSKDVTFIRNTIDWSCIELE